MTAASLAFLASAILAYGLTRLVLVHAIANQMLDHPNERSSHTTPTPRGGGFAIAVVALSGMAVCAAFGAIPRAVFLTLFGGGVLVAGIGWADDRKPRPALLRLSIQFLAAGWAVYWLGGLPHLRFGLWQVETGVWGGALAVIAIVWFTNLYNFMDGIDGLAAGEAVSVGSIAGILLLATGQMALSLIGFIIVGASAGFLSWNWPPARIFMGDVSSGLLGFLFASLALASENLGGIPLIWWGVLFLVFVFDSTVTLIRRLVRGQRVYDAHREHAYQRASRARGHTVVTITVLCINVFLGTLTTLGLAHRGWAPSILALAILLVAGAYLIVERIEPVIAHPRSRSIP